MKDNPTIKLLTDFITQFYKLQSVWEDEDGNEYSWKIDSRIIINYFPGSSKIRVSGPPMLEDRVDDIEEHVQNYLNQIK